MDESLAWLCQQGSVAAARHWHERLLAAIGTLQRQPQRFPLAPEAEELGIALREMLFGRGRGVRRILFIVEERTVHILHIRPSARDVLTPGDL